MEINELVNIFLYELAEEGSEFYNNISELETAFKNGQQDFLEVLDDIFVSIHTIKGSANTLLNSVKKQKHPIEPALREIAQLTHQLEDYIEYLKQHSNTLTDFQVNNLFLFDDILNKLSNSLKNNTPDIPNAEIETLLNNIRADNSIKKHTIDNEKNNISGEEQRHFFELTLSCEEELKHGFLSLIYRDIEEEYEKCFFNPTKATLLEGKDFNTITLQIISQQSSSIILDFIKTIPYVKNVQLIPYRNSFKEAPINSNNTPIKTDKMESSLRQPIKIDASRIDNVLKYTSQLVILGNSFEEFLNNSNFLAGTKKRKELESIFEEINMNIEFLQSSVLEIRMTPFEQLFARFPRDVRALSNKYKKPINFKAIGHSTEIDKSILDELSEPFMHLIRNAIIHGIESPEGRKKNNKTEEGNITIQAKHDKNRVVIHIIDDGKGINVSAVKKSALDKNIISKEQYLKISDEETLDLIFEPGISSKTNIDEYSGRGMGMEAVRKKIEKLNGSISVDSIENVGTTITLYLPLTTAIIEGMITKINNEYFTFPISQVVEVINIHKDEIKTLSGQDYILLQKREIPIIYASDFFDFDYTDDKTIPFIKLMILQAQNHYIGFTIDEFLGQQSVVVKKLHPFIQYAKGISNCHILGDGSISLIIDSNDLTETLKKASD